MVVRPKIALPRMKLRGSIGAARCMILCAAPSSNKTVKQ
jgi:hypothetical protein